MSRVLRSTLVLSEVIALGLVVTPLRSAEALAPGPFEVTKTADTYDGACDGDCSLREAVVAANDRSGADVIVVPAGPTR
ncbi:MAG TPA: CSLREA domain-containing protein [Actinomycetota bacterium]|nr:CSLREA domain-containing protein [Actinomycetota bacterium]